MRNSSLAIIPKLVPTLVTQSVLGFPVHLPASDGVNSNGRLTQNAYLDWLTDRIERGESTHAVTLNAEMIVLAQRDREFAQVLLESDLSPPDGAGVVLALQLQGQTVDRCPGIELAEALLALAARNDWSTFILGGKPELLPKVLQYWRDRYPALRLDGHHGYFAADDEPSVIERLQAANPQLVYVGLGVPRQEYWIRGHRHQLPHATWLGVGGSLDIWSGAKARAPRWFRDYHLEWLYRLYQEPWRWRRMLALPEFAWQVLVRGVTSQ
jgi:N-acetylglucosaminyldiphosphoundecaprenol N-acetyl-beta-D-mannosaminyltransferase